MPLNNGLPEKIPEGWLKQIREAAKQDNRKAFLWTLLGSSVVAAVVTQNIDGLHQRAGTSPDRLIEVHGTVHDVVCMSCGCRGPMQPVLERVRAGEEDPPCSQCGGILKSATISFGQALVPEVITRAMETAAGADLLIAVGTSLQVYPVAGVVPIAKRARARVVIINAEPTPLDHLADAVISKAIGEVLPVICGGS